jgi:hypothetical protein
MKIVKTDKKDAIYGTIFTISEQKRNGAWGITLYVSSDPTNCKLSYIHGGGQLCNLDDEEKKEAIDFVLKHCKGYVIMNTTNKLVAKWITENYETYFKQDVPVGYTNGFQYVISIRNNIVVNSSCKVPVKKVAEVAKDPVLAEKLRAFLKKKRRKDDYVEDFVNSL